MSELVIERRDAVSIMQAHAIFEILVREHAAMLTVFIRSTLRDQAAADDVFQETLLTAWRRLDDYDKSRPFGPWLRGIASNLILATLRNHKKLVWLPDEQLLTHLDDRCEQLASAPGDTLDEKLELLRACVQALPDTYREVIEGKMRQDEDANDALADQLGLNLETVKKRLQRARARLVECMQRKLAALLRETNYESA